MTDSDDKQTISLPHITEQEIQSRFNEGSWSRGRRYFQEGNIFAPRLQGRTLKARCLGSQAQAYRVQVILGPDGIASADCSCPIGAGGYCKHTVALLLTWIHTPDVFTRVEEMEANLQRRSQADLVALICKMIDRYPELEEMLELPTLDQVASRQPIDPELIRRQAAHALRGTGYEEDKGYGLQPLDELFQLGNNYARQQDWSNAAVVYETIAREILDQYSSFQDEEGDLIGLVNDCVSGLGECLAGTDNPELHQSLIRALFDIYRWDVEFGGVGAGDEVPDILLEHATPEERRQVAQWARQALPEGDTWSDSYHRQVLGGFLLDMEQEQLDDEAFLRLCQETDRRSDMVNRLLALGRTEEAIAAARQADDYTLLGLANLLVAHGKSEQAGQLIRERARTSRDNRLLVWLKQQAQEHGNRQETLSLSQELFWRQPNLGQYQEIAELAQPEGRWEKLRAEILGRLGQDKQYDLLTEIYLAENLVDEALKTLDQVRSTRWGWGWGSDLDIRVAQAAEEVRPREAIRLYMETVEHLINAQGRSNYVTAVGYLQRVRFIYHHLREVEAWESLITGLRAQNRQRRALKEELERAGL